MEPNRNDVRDLAEEHGQALVAFAFVLSTDGDDAQDIVQTVLLRMLASGRTLDSPLAYARRAIVNEYLDRQRRHRRWLHSLATLRITTSVDVDGVDTAVTERETLVRAVRALNPRERAAVVLRYFADQDDANIAASIGCAPATVRSLINRALPRMRAVLTADHAGQISLTQRKKGGSR